MWRFAFSHRIIEFLHKHPEYVVEGNALEFLSDDGGNAYNNFHCESIPVAYPAVF